VNSSILKYNSSAQAINLQIRSLNSKPVSINPWFVSGLIDAEGCFHLGISANDKYKQNYNVVLMFTMSLHEKDKDLLIKLKDFFGVGSIIRHGPSSLQARKWENKFC
jgi:hypothetical protein